MPILNPVYFTRSLSTSMDDTVPASVIQKPKNKQLSFKKTKFSDKTPGTTQRSKPQIRFYFIPRRA
jgi:hypothetical protein